MYSQIYAEVGGGYHRYDIECPAKEVVKDDGGDDSSSSESGYFIINVKANPSCTPRKDMLRVSRAFKAEYEMEICRGAILYVTTLEDDDFFFGPKKLVKGSRAHRCFRSIPNLEIELRGGFSPSLGT